MRTHRPSPRRHNQANGNTNHCPTESLRQGSRRMMPPARLKNTLPVTATPSTALICKAEFTIPATMPAPPVGAQSINDRTSVGTAIPWPKPINHSATTTSKRAGACPAGVVATTALSTSAPTISSAIPNTSTHCPNRRVAAGVVSGPTKKPKPQGTNHARSLIRNHQQRR